jgi:hypothetical protein
MLHIHLHHLRKYEDALCGDHYQATRNEPVPFNNDQNYLQLQNLTELSHKIIIKSKVVPVSNSHQFKLHSGN